MTSGALSLLIWLDSNMMWLALKFRGNDLASVGARAQSLSQAA
mgnify:CR=1 FL=1